jgi:hypothetical protein
MAGFFNRNLSILKKKYPDLAQKISQIETTEAKLVPLDDGLFDLERNGKFIHKKDPLSDAQRLFQKTKLRNPHFVVFYGIGLGYHIKPFLEARQLGIKHALLVEKSAELFRLSLEASDWSSVLDDPRVTLVVGLRGQALLENLYTYMKHPDRFHVVRSVTSIPAPRLSRDEVGYYLEVSQLIKKAVDEVFAVFRGSTEDAYWGSLHVFQNLKASQNVPYIDDYRNLFKGTPGIIVATGPSLKHSFNWLEGAGDKAVIACADSALKLLLERNIRPHFTGCVERDPEIRELFFDLPRLDDIPLITNPIIYPEAYSTYPGPKIHIMRSIAQLMWFFNGAVPYDTGSSVSHLLFNALCVMGDKAGFNNFIFRVHLECLSLLIPKFADEMVEVTGIHAAGIQTNAPGKIRKTHHGNTIDINFLINGRPLYVSTCFNGHVHNNASGLHRLNHVSRDDKGGLTAKKLRCCNHHISHRTILFHSLAL